MQSELLSVIKTQRIQEDTATNEERIPIEDLGLLRMNPNEQESLVNIRLKANDLKWRIFRQICGYTEEEDQEGNIFLIKSKHLPGMVPITSAMKIIRTIEFCVNSNVRLGYVRPEEALHELEFIYIEITVSFVLDDHWVNVPVYIKDEVLSLLLPNLWHSLSGAIKGKEARAIVTNIQEQKGETKMHEKIEAPRNSGFMGIGGRGQ